MGILRFKKVVSFLLTAVLLLGLAASATQAATTLAWVGTNVKTSGYRSVDHNRVLCDIGEGEKVAVLQEYTNDYMCKVDGQESVVFIPKSAFPSFLNATPQYYASITETTQLYVYYTKQTGSLNTLQAGSTVSVLSSVGGFYFVKYDIFYGYVPQSVCTATNTVPGATPAATNSGNLASSLKGDPVAYGQVAAGAVLYEKPSKSSKVMGTFGTTGTVGIIAQTGTASDNAAGYYYISSGNNYMGFVETVSVFVSDAYLQKIPTDISLANQTVTATTATAGTATVANCTKWVSMRSDAKSSAKRLAKVPLNASVSVLGTDGSYTKVTYNGKTGYILSTYIKK